MWYGFGDDWLNHIVRAGFDRDYSTIFKIKISDSVLILNGRDDIFEFSEKYGIIKDWLESGSGGRDTIRWIQWEKVAKKYSGIEIKNPDIFKYKEIKIGYRDRVLLDWLNGWDISSGCIWNQKGIESIERIY